MSAPIAGARSISVDQAMRVARQTLPGAAVTDILLPATSRGTFMFRMRIPWETAPTVMSMVTIDQYSGRVLWSWDLRKSLVREVIRFNRSIHTGDLLGFPGHVLVSLFSLALVFMVVTGVVIWWKKLAI